MSDLRKAVEELAQQVVEGTAEKDWPAWASDALTALREALAAPVVPEPVAWRTFDGEGGYDFRSYEDNEDYRKEYIKRNGEKYASWVEPLYLTANHLLFSAHSGVKQPSQTRFTVAVEGQAFSYWDNLHDALTQAQRAVYCGPDNTFRAIEDLKAGRIAEWSYGFSAVRIYPPPAPQPKDTP